MTFGAPKDGEQGDGRGAPEGSGPTPHDAGAPNTDSPPTRRLSEDGPGDEGDEAGEILGGADDTRVELIEAMVEAGAAPEDIAPKVEELEPADAADTLMEMGSSESVEVLQQMETESAADALAHMDVQLAVTVLLDLDPGEAADLVGQMEPDDAADLIQGLPKPLASEILGRLPPRRAATLGKLALFDPRSAGGLMTTDIAVVDESMTIAQAVEFVRTRAMVESQPDLYVVDADRHLVGTIGLRQLLFADDASKVRDHARPGADAVLPGTPREEVADLFQRYDYITLPVVDDHRRLLGMVTIDDVLDIVAAERAEDPLKLVGVSKGETATGGALAKFRGRSPWLMINLLTAQAASSVLLLFHEFIELIPIVAVIYPVIANESGNTGQQSLAVTLRGLVLGQIRREVVAKLLLYEIVSGVLSGVVVGAFFAMSIGALHITGLMPEMSWQLGVVAGLAMTGAMTTACLVGAAIPLVLDRLGFDPATASSIFLTMLTDSLSYGVFLGLAFVMRGWLGVPVG